MSLQTVANKDFTSTIRSRAIWGVGTLLPLLCAIFVYSQTGYRIPAHEAVYQSFRLLSHLFGILIPLTAALVSYMAIANERETGGIKFLLSLPNTRRDVFLGKLASRLALVSSGVAYLFLITIAAAVAKHGSVPFTTLAGLFAVTTLYAAVFVCLAVAISAAVTAKTRAIATTIGTYFVTIILYAIPGFRPTAIVRWIHTSLLGFAPNPHLYDALTYLSPYIAFQKATNLVFPEAYQMSVFARSNETAANLPLYLSDTVALGVFAIWIGILPILGYRQFNRADID